MPRSASISPGMPSPLRALTLTIGASSRNEPFRNSWTSISTRSAMPGSTASIFVRTVRPRCTLSSEQIARCSRVCGITDSSAEMTSSTTSMPPTPASMFLMKRSCPGTSTKPSVVRASSARLAKPRSMVIPRSFSSFRRSVSVPVSAFTSAVLP